ncbi:MAG: hypothetical protein WC565_02570 [Parcubacteria group bacterium]
MEKEKIIKKRISLFRYVPFVRLAVISGSCVTGNVKNGSDIDIIIGVKDNRVYLCRALTLFICDLLHIRNKPPKPETNKLCLSHFMCMSDLKMNDPENSYETESYPFLFPVYGDYSACEEFFMANTHVIKKVPDYREYSLYVGGGKNRFIRIAEKMFSGRLGDTFESFARKKQSKKIQRRIEELAKNGQKTRVITSLNRIETYYNIH